MCVVNLNKKNFTQYKILVADKELIIALDIKFFLQKLGYYVLPIVNQSKKLLYMAQAENPSLIILDTTLDREFKGINTIIKISERLKVPYIFITASKYFDPLNYSGNLKPAAVIKKPIDHSELLYNVNKALYSTLEIYGNQKSCSREYILS